MHANEVKVSYVLPDEPEDIITDDEVYIGDNHNDVSMLKLAGLGIAMQNADQEVKNFAALVTEQSHDDETGLSTLLHSLFL